MISQDDGNTLRAQLGAGVTGTLRTDANFRAGADDQNRVLMYAPNPVEPGSSVSHWSTAATPNLLMEPFISPDLTDEVDATLDVFRDIGWPIPAVPVASVTHMSAQREGTAVTVQWSGPALERGGVEFHVYRSVDGGPRAQLTNTALGRANDYEFVDSDAPESALEYWLQVNWPGGAEDWAGPLAVQAAAGASLFQLAAPSPNPFREAGRTAILAARRGTGGRQRTRPARTTRPHPDRGRHGRRQPPDALDGRSDTGSPVASGVYFAQVEFGQRRQVQKITVAR